jgi:hypothetical protein
MKTPIILPAGGSYNLQLFDTLSEKICAHWNPRLIIHEVNKVNSITMHGNSLSHKVSNLVI